MMLHGVQHIALGQPGMHDELPLIGQVTGQLTGQLIGQRLPLATRVLAHLLGHVLTQPGTQFAQRANGRGMQQAEFGPVPAGQACCTVGRVAGMGREVGGGEQGLCFRGGVPG